jgi:asparagine synthase (glutamine-hydrolysing)
MSGICGWSNNKLPSETKSSTLTRMATKIKINASHAILEDSSDFYAFAATGSSASCGLARQGGVAVVVNGSIRFTESEMAKFATENGCAQAIIIAYRKHGIDFLKTILGSFALSLIDETNRRALIAIDRLGIGSLFYATRREQLLFSSNAKGLVCHPDAGMEIDPQSIYGYLYFHAVPSPRCIFKGVEKLLPGQYLLVDHDKQSKGFYWQPNYVESKGASIQKLEAEFFDIVMASVARAAEDPKTGAFLSGGTDSSTIAGLLRQAAGMPVNTYSIGFNAEGFDETYYARLASKHFDTIRHEYYLTPQNVVDSIPLIAKAYDEPFGNASAVPAYYCAKLAHADGLKTLLAGDGGDELFGGNERYAKQKIFEIYQYLPIPMRQHFIEPIILNFPLADKISPLAKAQSYIQQANIQLPTRLESYNFLNRMPLAEIFDADFTSRVNTNEPDSLLCETYGRAMTKSTLNRMLFLDLKFTLADNDLRKVNRMCELGQVEVRYPLLDDELVRFSSELPTSLKLRGYKLRYFFKHALRDFLPAEILNKSKHGFGLPFGMWMRSYEPLREIANESLIALSTRGIISPGFVKEILKRHNEYPSYYGAMIWVMIMLEQWLQSLSQEAFNSDA